MPAFLPLFLQDFAPSVHSHLDSTTSRKRLLDPLIDYETVSSWEKAPERLSWNPPHMPRNARQESMPKFLATPPPARPIIWLSRVKMAWKSPTRCGSPPKMPGEPRHRWGKLNARP